ISPASPTPSPHPLSLHDALPIWATMTPPQLTPSELERLADEIRGWGRELGFANTGIADTELSAEEARLIAWLDAGRHGEMDYMRSEEHTSELQSHLNLVCRLLLE